MQVFTRRLVTDWTLLQMPDHDVAIIGGGLLGSAFGWGLARKGLKPVIFDEGDAAIRTARGNFGLVWVQGKGRSMPEYAAWSFRASQLWTDFAQELKDNTGVDVHYLKEGYHILATESEFEKAIAGQKHIEASLGDKAYGYEVLDRAALKSAAPMVADSVPGAIHTGHDGHCNPLFLMRTLHQDMQAKGADYRPNMPVSEIRLLAGGGYELKGRNSSTLASAEKVIVAAGHGSGTLLKGLGIDLPVYADQGQVLVTEKVSEMMAFATGTVRQTDNGSFLLGASSREIGLDTRTRPADAGQSRALLRVGLPVSGQSAPATGLGCASCDDTRRLSSLSAIRNPSGAIFLCLPQRGDTGLGSCIGGRRLGREGAHSQRTHCVPPKAVPCLGVQAKSRPQ